MKTTFNLASLTLLSASIVMGGSAGAQSLPTTMRNPYVAPSREVVIPQMEQSARPPAAPASSIGPVAQSYAAPERTGKPLEQLLSQLALVGSAGPVALLRQRVDTTRTITHALRDGTPWMVDGRTFVPRVVSDAMLEVHLYEGKRLVGVIRPDAPQPQLVSGSSSVQTIAPAAPAARNTPSLSAPAPAPAAPRLMGSPSGTGR